jgi:DNA-binding response OmpR family regulator
LTPPFTSRRLLYRVKKLAGTLPDRGIRLGGLVLDPDTRTLRQGETTVHLRPKEAELLALFMRNPGQVLSRRQIMAEVWDTDYLEDTRTLNVHVCWLRAKIEAEPGVQCRLRTVRGVGYRFDAPQPRARSKGSRPGSQPEPKGHS